MTITTYTVRSALPAFIESVRSYFATNKISATVEFGVNQLARQINQGEGGANRVVFSIDPDGDGGAFIDARLKASPGGPGVPRPIVTWEKTFIVSVWAVDTSDKGNELLQFVAVENLLESTVQAVRAFAHADVTWGNPKWTTSPIEAPFGRELRIPIKMRGALFSLANPTRTPSPVVARDPQ